MIEHMSGTKEPTWTYLARKPDSDYQQFFIKGTRIAARTLYTTSQLAKTGRDKA